MKATGQAVPCAEQAEHAVEKSKGWIASPAFDMLLIANVGWPILLLPGLSTSSDSVIDFWQVYFLTLPHRWITLLLVAADSDRRRGKSFLLVSIAIALACLVGGTLFGSRVFLCLGLIDYVWNAWHFASQHSGVLRMYSRKIDSRNAHLPGVRGANEWLERWGLRSFITFVVLRAAGSLIWGEYALAGPSASLLKWWDLVAIAIPVAILISNLSSFNLNRVPKLIYLASVLGLYSGYLLAARWNEPRAIVALATGATAFHAVEYLAVVTHYAQRRASSGSEGFMRRLAPHWSMLLILYVLALGTAGWCFAAATGPYATIWQGLNLWAAFTHYAFDGVIWKLRKPETAQALGVA